MQIRALLVGLLVLVMVAGCGSPAAQLKSNLVYTHKKEKNAGKVGDREQDIDAALEGLFGTPDDPHTPNLGAINWEEIDFSGEEAEALANFELTTLLEPSRLAMAGGPVLTKKELARPQGLYREHCAHCHGISGDGAGPTAAFLNPYPRDYRPGIFKFKSTPLGKSPTQQDLHAIVVNGIPGTAMPSFKLLPADEIDALIQYVKYLSIRGEVERGLIDMVLDDREEGERLVDTKLKESDPAKFATRLSEVKNLVAKVAAKWWLASLSATPVTKPSETLSEDDELSIARGREIFYTVANCNKCHGDSGLGDGESNIFDKWTEELDHVKNPKSLPEYLKLGALEPRNLQPRNLRQGVYRGGRRPLDIYWRVFNGIDGTGMPAVKDSVLKEGDAPDPKKLSQEDVWHFVNYVRHMPYEEISRPSDHDPAFQRERN